MRASWKTSLKKLEGSVDGASLGLFRMGVGAAFAWEMGKYLRKDWVTRDYDPEGVHFPFFGFDWLPVLPLTATKVLFAVLLVSGVLIALGAWRRPAAGVFAAGFGYLFLLDQSHYQNHFYLMILLALLCALTPGLEWGSAIRKLRTEMAPAWVLALFRFQIGIVYVFAGLSKLNGEWLSGRAMGLWLQGSDVAFLPSWLLGKALAVAGTGFDLLIVPALLYRRTRPFAFAAAVFFHLTNSFLFNIGIFPFLAIVATTLFLEPGWVRRFLKDRRVRPEAKVPAVSPRWRTFWAAYCVLQVLVPMRHWLYPGDPDWTGDGHRFAWRMMLVDKRGDARFEVMDRASGRRAAFDPRRVLRRRQYRAMVQDPDMILQMAHEVGRKMRSMGAQDMVVRARVMVSLNGREPVPFIDPETDLTGVRRTLLPKSWVKPDPRNEE